MRTWSSRSLIRLIRSSPSPDLRVMSTTATSGLVSASRRRASPTSAASPQTSRSGCRPIRTASASRTAGWSSTISTRAFLPWRLLLIVLPRQYAGDRGAGRLGRTDRQLRPDDRRAVLHDSQAQALELRGPRRHAGAVVPHREDEVGVRRQGDAHTPRPGVLDGVAHRLLAD